MSKKSRLQFTEEERAAPTLEKSIAKSEKAAVIEDENEYQWLTKQAHSLFKGHTDICLMRV